MSQQIFLSKLENVDDRATNQIREFVTSTTVNCLHTAESLQRNVGKRYSIAKFLKRPKFTEFHIKKM